MTPLEQTLASIFEGVRRAAESFSKTFVPAMRKVSDAVTKLTRSFSDYLIRMDGRYPESDLAKMDPFDRALSEAHNEHVLAMNRYDHAITTAIY